MHAAVRDLTFDFDREYVESVHENATPISVARRVRRRIYIDLTMESEFAVIDLTRT